MKDRAASRNSTWSVIKDSDVWRGFISGVFQMKGTAASRNSNQSQKIVMSREASQVVFSK